MEQDGQWAFDQFKHWVSGRVRRHLLFVGFAALAYGLVVVSIRVQISGEGLGDALATSAAGAVLVPIVVGGAAWWMGPVKPLAKVRRLRPVRVLQSPTPDTVRVVGEAGQLLQWRVGRAQRGAVPAPGCQVWATEPVARGAHIALVVEDPLPHGGHVIEPLGPSWRQSSEPIWSRPGGR